GSLKANTAQVEDARLQLSWTSIVAPIAGRLGLRRIDPGNQVSSGDTEGLVTITQMRPIAVEFSVPEPDVPALRRAMAADGGLAVQALDRDGRNLLSGGRLQTPDRQTDLGTGTVRPTAECARGRPALCARQGVRVRRTRHAL